MKSTFMATTSRAEFDVFLYATIVDERNGTPLSVLSALAREDLDPWDEAARLARMPREAATSVLASVIAAQRPSSATSSNALENAARQIALLPRRFTKAPAPTAVASPAVASPDLSLSARVSFFYIATIVFMVLSNWLFAPPQVEENAVVSSAPTAEVAPHAQPDSRP